ncbi:hypothetical protein HanRHA438_Chr15g0698791 [Helianthus annuus]|uniref:Uncharacterized protein n=1 Tax=Helianthus annuus TaxID=4232 RepID=A0A9K3E124_HELAN|nr:hypothetical protein HanXRQr2_Chr15g0686611 [Helianthus annuus]KAJ0450726.1 hypothetical protein HanHA300_Chr15g0559491 [Helianthus annuus]KAJ0454977.1 hypothetical protein HanIR_Chr15g0746041 [Helianthus annuus]KAJ0472578.1 hypothetical protein HanHA89_Chr15g0608621 [Helianthus annuus]KAJ0648182.1 hypothetical protein HanLR1_Chr15g0570011 [Helianthus annuus]
MSFMRHGEESVDHLFTACVVATRLWQCVSRWCKIPHFFAFSFKDILEASRGSGLREPSRLALQGIMVISSWCL